MDTIAAGFVAGIASDAVTYPLSTVKVRLQVWKWPAPSVATQAVTQVVTRSAATASATTTSTVTAAAAAVATAPASVPRGTWSLLTHIARTEGVHTLYTGFSINLLTGPGRALYFGAYESAHALFTSLLRDYGGGDHRRGNGDGDGHASAANDALARGLAGPVAQMSGSLIWVPMDVCKERMQAQQHASSSLTQQKMSYRGPFNVATRILQEEGVAFLYRGFLLHQLLWGPFNALFFPLLGAIGNGIESRRRASATAVLLSSPSPSSSSTASAASLSSAQTSSSSSPSSSSSSSYTREWWVTPLAAVTSGMFAGWLTAPLDTVKTRLQTQVRFRGAIDCVRTTIAEEGVATLWRGATTRAVWIGPNMMITMSLYELIKQQLSTHNDDQYE